MLCFSTPRSGEGGACDPVAASMLHGLAPFLVRGLLRASTMPDAPNSSHGCTHVRNPVPYTLPRAPGVLRGRMLGLGAFLYVTTNKEIEHKETV
jgi:hypothetical protein